VPGAGDDAGSNAGGATDGSGPVGNGLGSGDGLANGLAAGTAKGDGTRLGAGDGVATRLGVGDTSEPQPATTRVSTTAIVTPRIRSGIRSHAGSHFAATYGGDRTERRRFIRGRVTREVTLSPRWGGPGGRLLALWSVIRRHLDRAAPRHLRTIMWPRPAPIRRP
jgi:hypothetical protein